MTTSHDCYHATLPRLPAMQRRVLDALRALHAAGCSDVTRVEVQHHLDASGLSGGGAHEKKRVTELVARGLVERVGERVCRVTGQRVECFRVVGSGSQPNPPAPAPAKALPAPNVIFVTAAIRGRATLSRPSGEVLDKYDRMGSILDMCS